MGDTKVCREGCDTQARLRQIVLLYLPEEAENEVHHQLKRITVDNWKHVDDLIHFPQAIAEQTWVKACMKPQLPSKFPRTSSSCSKARAGRWYMVGSFTR